MMMSSSPRSPAEFRQSYEDHKASTEDIFERDISNVSKNSNLYVQLLTKLKIG